jgi:hypothetical protein
MKVQIFLQDKTQDLWRGEKLATIEVNPIEGYNDREVVNNAIKPIKYWLMGIYNQSLIVAINE